MLKIKFCTVIIFSLFTSLLFSASVALSGVKEIIIFSTPEYTTHEEGLVSFNHQQHLAIKDNGGYGISCGECHHDKEGLPLLELQAKDKVNRCIECHNNTGKKTKEEKLSKKQEIKEYHKKALHTSCKGCHKKFNKKNNLKKKDPASAPLVCKECHSRESKESKVK